MQICQGDTIAIRIWHLELTSPVGATAHVAAALGGEVIFESTTPIPSSSGQISETFVAERDYPAGTVLQFHLHNHGNSEYALLRGARRACGASSSWPATTPTSSCSSAPRVP